MASFCKSIYGMEKKFRSFTERFFTKKRIKMRGKIKFTTKIRSIAGTIVKYIFKNYNMISVGSSLKKHIQTNKKLIQCPVSSCINFYHQLWCTAKVLTAWLWYKNWLPHKYSSFGNLGRKNILSIFMHWVQRSFLIFPP